MHNMMLKVTRTVLCFGLLMGSRKDVGSRES